MTSGLLVGGLTARLGDTWALSGVDLHVHPGEVVGLVGPNGSGKSTLVRSCLRAVEARGTVEVDGRDVTRMTVADLARRAALVSQQEELAFSLTVGEMVLLGRSVHRSGWSSWTEEDRRIAQDAMALTGVTSMADRGMGELSGGERQRVLIARALAQGGGLLLLDEPTNHLDVRYQHEILALLRSLEVATLVVLHDLNLAARYCDRLVLLDQGRVVAEGTAEEIFVPEILDPVYRMSVEVIEVSGVRQLVLSLPI